jgi:hypothetical protein
MQAVMQAAVLERDARRRGAGDDVAVTAVGGGGGVERAKSPSTPVPPRSKNHRHVPLSPLATARRFAALVLLLEAFHELRGSLRSGDGDAYRGGGVLLADHEPGCALLRRGRVCSCVQSAVAECERLLAEMRWAEPRLRFHLVAWFVDAERKGRWERRTGRRRRLSPLVYRRIVVRDPRAERELAIAGVAWLAERWNLRDVRDELVEPWLVGPGVDARQGSEYSRAHSGLVRSFAG